MYIIQKKEVLFCRLNNAEGEKVHKHINSFGFGIWSQTHTFLFCRPSFVGVPFLWVSFFKGKEEKRGGKKTHLGSRFWPLRPIAIQRVVPKTHYSKSEEYTLRERERERVREREKERSDPDRVDARVRASRSRCWSGSLAEREGERERDWIPFTLLFSQLSFLSLLGVVAAVKKAKKGRKTGKFGPKRARSG